jgi:hypothetical protein
MVQISTGNETREERGKKRGAGKKKHEFNSE